MVLICHLKWQFEQLFGRLELWKRYKYVIEVNLKLNQQQSNQPMKSVCYHVGDRWQDCTMCPRRGMSHKLTDVDGGSQFPGEYDTAVVEFNSILSLIGVISTVMLCRLTSAMIRNFQIYGMNIQ